MPRKLAKPETRQCKYCYAKFETDMEDKLYCSIQCRSKFNNEKVIYTNSIINCPHCGEEIDLNKLKEIKK